MFYCLVFEEYNANHMQHYTIYMDESGIASLADNGNQFFVLTGLIVEDKTDAEFSSYFRYVKRRHGLDEDTQLHAYDVLEDSHNALYIHDNQQCKDLTASMAEFVENAPFNIHVAYIDKEQVRSVLGAPKGYSFRGSKKHKEDKDIAYEALARKLFFEFAKLLKKNKAIGSIVAESRRGADSILLKAYLDTQDPQTFSENDQSAKLAKLARDHIHSICFSGKKSLKAGLELADVISYLAYSEITKRFPNKRNDRRGLKSAWERIKACANKKEPQLVAQSELKRVIPDRINEISKRVQHRLEEFRDLVNPTQR